MYIAECHEATPAADTVVVAPTAARLSDHLSLWLRETRTILRRDPGRLEACFDRLEQLLGVRSDAAASIQPLRNRTGGLAPWQIARVKRHINAHLADRLSNSELAALVGVSKNYFGRAFKVSTGRTPHEYIIKERIAHAKRLISYGDLPLSQVALEAGLTDQAHLSRLFRRHVGTTPSAWRWQHRALQPREAAA